MRAYYNVNRQEVGIHINGIRVWDGNTLRTLMPTAGNIIEFVKRAMDSGSEIHIGTSSHIALDGILSMSEFPPIVSSGQYTVDAIRHGDTFYYQQGQRLTRRGNI